jgi:hypothetical protein
MTRGVSETLPTQLPARFRTGFAWKLDRRSKVVREIAADLYELWTDLGGPEGLSVQERILCERVVYLRRRVLEYETAIINGKTGTMTPGEHANATNTLVGLLKALGLERRARPVRKLHDAMQGRAA